MRRTGRRRASDYLENEELNETYEGYEEFVTDEAENTEDNDTAYDEAEDSPQRKSIWVKIGKIAVIILVLIALFFVSMKVTEIFLDRNQEPEYGSDAPAYSDSDTQQDEDIPAINEQPEEDEDVPELEQYEEQDKTPVKKPEEDKKPEEKPQDSQKPAEKPVEKPAETEKPSTEPTPSKPSKPLIIPGNPAA